MRQLISKVIFIITLSLLCQNTALAQGEGNIWYFGEGNGVNFNQSCDIADLSSSMEALEGTVSLSDENGNLLFYTNGGRFSDDPGSTGIIWNRNHEVMYDMGTTEGGGVSARQSSLAIPKPGDSNHYYLFTMDENEAINAGTFRGFSYFEIDMDLNGGLGGVVDYQESLSVFPFGNEGMAGVRRPDNNSYWVVVAGGGGFEFYLIDENGVNLDHTQQLNSSISISPFTFSPNGAYVSFGSNVLDFDAETGLFSNETNFLTVGVNPVGSAFSPNSRYLFISQVFGNSVYRFDMEAADVLGSLIELATLSATTVCGNMLPAPDGNLYFLHTDPTNNPGQISFSGILCPNSEDPCVKEDVYVFPFSNNTLGPGLPNFLDHYFMSDVVENGLEVCTEQSALQICEGEEVTLSVTHYLAETFEWSTGASSNTISVFSPGTYTVTVSDGCCNTSEELFEILSNSGGTLGLEIQGETVICDGESTTLTANSDLAISYEWSTGSTNPSIEVSAPGLYSVTVTDECDDTLIEELEITEPGSIDLDLNLTGNLSCGGQVIAAATSNTSNIQWSTGETGDQIILEESGSYSVSIENACESQTENFTIAPEAELFEIPNAFTPDQDGINDIFRPVWGCDEIDNFDFKIFNRWGQIVYESSDPFGGWDGTFKGSPATSDVFIYSVSFQISNNSQVDVAGDVTLIR